MNTFTATILAATTFIVACAHGQAMIPDDYVFPELLILGKVGEITEENGFLRHTIVVSHAYNGRHLEEHTFVVRSTKSGQGSRGINSFYPGFSIGERVIWALREDQGVLLSAVPGVRVHYPFLPARESELATFNLTKTWAEAVEQVIQIPPRDRLAALKQFASSDNQYIVEWAIRVLAAAAPVEFRNWAQLWLSQQELPLSTQVVLDKNLAQVDETWLRADARNAMLRKWVASPLSEQDALRILARLETGITLKEVDPRLAYEMIAAIAKADTCTQIVRMRAIVVLERAMNDPKVHADAFELLSVYIEAPPDTRTQLTAASSLRKFDKLTGSEMARVVALREAAKVKADESTDKHDQAHQLLDYLTAAADQKQ